MYCPQCRRVAVSVKEVLHPECSDCSGHGGFKPSCHCGVGLLAEDVSSQVVIYDPGKSSLAVLARKAKEREA